MAGGIWEPDDFSPEPPPRWAVVLLVIVAVLMLGYGAAPFVSELVGPW